jgi:hypothetical protein
MSDHYQHSLPFRRKEAKETQGKWIKLQSWPLMNSAAQENDAIFLYPDEFVKIPPSIH